MKKVLSLVLAFAMILGSFGFVFATDYSDVADTAVYGEAVNVLSGLGVIGGYPDGTFRPTNIVTRAEMATMIVNALGIPVKGGATTKFSDVPSSHWASGYINYATSVGFVAGYPDGTFKPEQQVTCNEALTMIVASLGYTLSSLTGDYPGAFVSKAQGLGILDTCKKVGTIGAERSDIACYLYDTLQERIGAVNKDEEFVPYVLTYDKATDTYTYDTMLHRLGATDYDGGNGEGEPFVVEGDEGALINLQNYLGAYITAYQNKDGDIIAVKEVKSEFIEGDVDDLKDDYKGFDSAKKVDYVSFKNGDASTGKAAADYTTMKGDLKLAVKLSGKTIKEVYSVQVWTDAHTFRAGSDIQDEITDDQSIGGYDFALNDDDEIDTATFALVGDRAALKDLAEDDIVTVYLDKDSKIAKVEVSTKTVEGEVTKISTGSTPKYTIAGTAYKLADDAACTAPALEDEGTFFLNYAGKIYDFDPVEGTSNYAIVLGTGADAQRYGSTASGYAKLFLADGTTKEFTVDKAVTGTITGNKWANTYAEGSLVKYTVNSSDKITEIVIAAGTAGKGEFDANGIYNKMALSATTVIFSYNGGDKDDADSYEVLKLDDLKEAEFTGMTYAEESKSFKAVCVSGVSSADDIFAVFVSKDASVKDGYVWTALYDGKVQDLTLEKALTPATYTTGSAVKMYTLAFTSDNIVNKTNEVAAADYASVPADVSAATSVSGSIFKDGAKASYSLDKAVAVYVYDESDDEWTAKSASALGGRKGAFTSITLVDSDKDGDYDIAIVTKE